MSKSRLPPLPFWAKNVASNPSLIDCDSTVGIQPDFAPRLPMRILPFRKRSTLTAFTLRDLIEQAQRIITYAAYEVVNGFRPEFSDLRLVDDAIIKYATLYVEPFEEGSFIIPTALKDSPTKITMEGTEQEFTGNQIIQRFSDVMNEVTTKQTNASIGLVQSIESLGVILKREAERIEFYPVGIPGKSDSYETIIVDEKFIEKVSQTRKRRLDPRSIPDTLSGTLVMVDLARGSLKLKINQRHVVNGSFSPFLTDLLVESLRKTIRLSGVVEYSGDTPKFIRAFVAEAIDETPNL